MIIQNFEANNYAVDKTFVKHISKINWHWEVMYVTSKHQVHLGLRLS